MLIIYGSVPVKVEGVSTWQSPWYYLESIHEQSGVTCALGRPWLDREMLLGLAKPTERFVVYGIEGIVLKRNRAKQYFEEMPINDRILGKGAVVLDVDMLLHSAYFYYYRRYTVDEFQGKCTSLGSMTVWAYTWMFSQTPFSQTHMFSWILREGPRK